MGEEREDGKAADHGMTISFLSSPFSSSLAVRGGLYSPLRFLLLLLLLLLLLVHPFFQDPPFPPMLGRFLPLSSEQFPHSPFPRKRTAVREYVFLVPRKAGIGVHFWYFARFSWVKFCLCPISPSLECCPVAWKGRGPPRTNSFPLFSVRCCCFSLAAPGMGFDNSKHENNVFPMFLKGKSFVFPGKTYLFGKSVPCRTLYPFSLLPSRLWNGGGREGGRPRNK